LRNTDLIAKENLGAITLPATISTGGYHVATGVVHIKLRDGSGAVTRYNEEWHGRVSRGLFVLQVV
jgi:hypothetical protein